MSGLVRYAMEKLVGSSTLLPVPRPDGEWVKHSEAATEIERLTTALKPFADEADIIDAIAAQSSDESAARGAPSPATRGRGNWMLSIAPAWTKQYCPRHGTRTLQIMRTDALPDRSVSRG